MSKKFNDTDLINVKSISNGSVGYTLPDTGVKRTWNTGETKKIPFGELRSFSYVPGGIFALTNLLCIEDKDAIDAILNMNMEPEYFYTEEDIRKVLFEGSIDEFADFLDFAPEGALSIAKDLAVKGKLPDVRKREMLSKKTGLNINNAIMVNDIMDAEDEDTTEADAPKKRRVEIEQKEEEKEEAPKRRTSYKVVEKK